MRVNSAFTAFFANRLVVRSGIPIVMFAVFFIASSFEGHSDPGIEPKQVNLIIRQIGHRLLQQAGDSTSLVPPVTKPEEGVFLLNFENEFVFNHDSLIRLTESLLPKKEFPSGYTVTVHDCRNGDIVYGFQVSNTTPGIMACKGRIQPPGCYALEFAFPDFYDDTEPKRADIYKRTEKLSSAKVGSPQVNSKSEELKTTPSGYYYDKRARVSLRESNPKTEKLKTATFSNLLINVIYGGILVLLSVIWLIGRFKKTLKPVPVQGQPQAVIKEFVPELPALGKFLFNAKDQHLLLGTEVISLTDKECQVLELLHKNFGELIPRDTLMQEVWINEGVITTRSLDMFVSKLRKKLSRDPELRITNVHGKGYKLEISET
jgi:hypothetical protein